MRNCQGWPIGQCRDRIPDDWTLCQRCQGRRPVFPMPDTSGRCGGGHGAETAPQATVRVRFLSPADGRVLAAESLCQPCADAVALPWVRAQRTALIKPT